MHKTCRSCHVPPVQVEPVTILTDCAVCHVPERGSFSLFRLLSGSSLTLDVAFHDSVPEPTRVSWQERLRARLSDSIVEVREPPAPNAAPVRIRVEMEVDRGRTPQGLEFFAVQGRAAVLLHRARIEVTSQPGVSTEEAGAVRKALEDLIERVALVLTR